MGNSSSKASSKKSKSSSSHDKSKKSNRLSTVSTSRSTASQKTPEPSQPPPAQAPEQPVSTPNIPTIHADDDNDANEEVKSRSHGHSSKMKLPSLSRTATGQSAKSSRSLRSRRSLNNVASTSGNNDTNTDDLPQIKKQVSNIETNAGSESQQRPGSHSHHRSHSQHLFPFSNGSSSHNVSEGSDNRLLNPRGKHSTSASRRSSFNTTTDLPPSMIQGQPKPPILKNSKYNQSSHSFQYDEHALTDDENDTNANNTSYSVQTPNQGRSNRQESVRHSHSSRPSSIKSGVSSSSRQRRWSDNSSSLDVPGSEAQGQSRSNSFASSSHSRKSSSGSNTNTAYSTPLNSPGITKANLQQKLSSEDGDYFAGAGDQEGDDARHGSSPYPHHQRSPSSVNNGNGNIDQQMGDDTEEGEYSNVARMDLYPSNVESFGTPMGDIDGAAGMTLNSVVGKKKKVYKPIDIDETIQKLLDAGYAAKRTKNVCLKNSEIAQICQQAREIFLSQPSLLELSPPVKIVGDIHGQYGDMLRLFTKCGFPPQSNYLFLGDYVDRGKQSLETILLLMCYKIKYRENFFILRGNHECANVTRVYGFYDECKRRCNIKTWKIFIDTFNTLPLAAIVAGKIFCVHGGLSPVLNSMDEIRHVSRPTDVPDFGLINDLLWSDPTDSPNEWEDNERGVSYCYNKVAINKFLNKFGFDLVCRAHMVVEDGYEFFNDRSLVTVFSAPNYCGEFDNWGAVMTVSDGLLCSFELLDPLDSTALKQVMKKGRQERKAANQQQQQLLQDQR